jgi:hypothetical protein
MDVLLGYSDGEDSWEMFFLSDCPNNALVELIMAVEDTPYSVVCYADHLQGWRGKKFLLPAFCSKLREDVVYEETLWLDDDGMVTDDDGHKNSLTLAERYRTIAQTLERFA